MSSCEQNSSQTKSDTFPDITKKFRRYQHEANDRESVSTKKKEKSPRKHENPQIRKQTKLSSSAVKEISQEESATAEDEENAPEQHSDMQICTGKQ